MLCYELYHEHDTTAHKETEAQKSYLSNSPKGPIREMECEFEPTLTVANLTLLLPLYRYLQNMHHDFCHIHRPAEPVFT